MTISKSNLGLFTSLSIDWNPFTVCNIGEKAPASRSLGTKEGLGDRLRFVAFAEKQAVAAFSSAAKIYSDAPLEARELWMELSREEEKHMNLLLDRMKELDVSIADRPQSLSLWASFDHCKTPKEFAVFMANAEEWGRQSGEKFYQTLLKVDPVTALLFQRIAKEEEEHIRFAASVLKLL